MQETNKEISSWRQHRKGVKTLKASQCQGHESDNNMEITIIQGLSSIEDALQL